MTSALLGFPKPETAGRGQVLGGKHRAPRVSDRAEKCDDSHQPAAGRGGSARGLRTLSCLESGADNPKQNILVLAGGDGGPEERRGGATHVLVTILSYESC